MTPTVAQVSLGAVDLVHGGRLGDAVIVYATYGRLNERGDNAVLLPTYYTGSHDSYAGWIGPGQALDPAKHFIVIPDMFGNGWSTSPSHWPAGPVRAGFPRVDIQDNVACQHRLLTETLGVKRLALVAGWSMGAMQAYAWAAMYPHMVKALLPVCGAARCWPLNRVFLEGVRAALTADAAWARGAYLDPPVSGLRAFGRAYCGWAYSARFFRDRLYRGLGADTLEDFLTAWEDEHLVWDAGDLLAMLDSWAAGDIASLAGGDYAQALGRIEARTIVMPSDTDAYFTLEENAIEAGCIDGAVLRPLVSPYGHCAGAPGRFAAETAEIERAMRTLLADG
jgi:homoserine O-acetyltransferase